MSLLFYAATAAAIFLASHAMAEDQRPVSTPKGDKLAASHHHRLGAGCTVATVAPDRAVTVDWKCAEEAAAGSPQESDGALMAVILLAVRDGKAISK